MPVLGTTELLILAGIVVLLFGAKKLPELARGLGQSVRELREGIGDDDDGANDAR